MIGVPASSLGDAARRPIGLKTSVPFSFHDDGGVGLVLAHRHTALGAMWCCCEEIEGRDLSFEEASVYRGWSGAA